MGRSDTSGRLGLLLCCAQRQSPRAVFAHRSCCTNRRYVFQESASFRETPSYVRIYCTCIRISALHNLLVKPYRPLTSYHLNLRSAIAIAADICLCRPTVHRQKKHLHELVAGKSEKYFSKKAEKNKKSLAFAPAEMIDCISRRVTPLTRTNETVGHLTSCALGSLSKY